MLTSLFAKQDIVHATLEPNGLNFFGDIPIDIQLVIFSLLSNVNKLYIGGKTIKI